VAAGAGVAVLAGACVAPALVSALVLSADLSSRGVAAGVFVPFALGLGMAAPWPLVGAGFAALPKPGAWMAHVKKAFAAIFAAMAAVYAARAWALCAPGGAAARPWSKPPAQGALKFLADETAAVELALAAGKPLLVEFSADWCSACHAMEKGTLAAPEVVAAIDGAHGRALLKIDCTDTADPAVEAALTRFGVRGLPFFAVLRPKE
ncbi:MAG: thioredoxin family protein, partial [Kiritimatiellae bacterium]|nr:thioredoxin family protein [Kiritimatiellia bacterium]